MTVIKGESGQSKDRIAIDLPLLKCVNRIGIFIFRGNAFGPSNQSNIIAQRKRAEIIELLT